MPNGQNVKLERDAYGWAKVIFRGVSGAHYRVGNGTRPVYGVSKVDVDTPRPTGVLPLPPLLDLEVLGLIADMSTKT